MIRFDFRNSPFITGLSAFLIGRDEQRRAARGQDIRTRMFEQQQLGGALTGGFEQGFRTAGTLGLERERRRTNMAEIAAQTAARSAMIAQQAQADQDRQEALENQRTINDALLQDQQFKAMPPDAKMKVMKIRHALDGIEHAPISDEEKTEQEMQLTSYMNEIIMRNQPQPRTIENDMQSGAIARTEFGVLGYDRSGAVREVSPGIDATKVMNELLPDLRTSMVTAEMTRLGRELTADETAAVYSRATVEAARMASAAQTTWKGGPPAEAPPGAEAQVIPAGPPMQAIPQSRREALEQMVTEQTPGGTKSEKLANIALERFQSAAVQLGIRTPQDIEKLNAVTVGGLDQAAEDAQATILAHLVEVTNPAERKAWEEELRLITLARRETRKVMGE
jgi:hypothetical protein